MIGGTEEVECTRRSATGLPLEQHAASHTGLDGPRAKQGSAMVGSEIAPNDPLVEGVTHCPP